VREERGERREERGEKREERGEATQFQYISLYISLERHHRLHTKNENNGVLRQVNSSYCTLPYTHPPACRARSRMRRRDQWEFPSPLRQGGNRRSMEGKWRLNGGELRLNGW